MMSNAQAVTIAANPINGAAHVVHQWKSARAAVRK